MFFFHHALKHRIIGLLGNQVTYKHIYIYIILSRIALISITKAKLTKKKKKQVSRLSRLHFSFVLTPTLSGIFGYADENNTKY